MGTWKRPVETVIAQDSDVRLVYAIERKGICQYLETIQARQLDMLDHVRARGSGSAQTEPQEVG